MIKKVGMKNREAKKHTKLHIPDSKKTQSIKRLGLIGNSFCGFPRNSLLIKNFLVRMERPEQGY